MSTKKLTGIILGLFLCFEVFSQQIPMYNLYYFNPFLYNPALAGQNIDGPRVFGLFRNQWTNMPGGPITDVFSLDGSIKKKKIGLGVMLINDQTDLLTRVTLNLAYSYLIKIDDDQGISLGLMMGFVNQNIDFNKAIVKDPHDLALYTNNYRDKGFDGAAGINYYWKNLNLGFSIPQLLSTNFKYNENYHNSTYYPVQHYLFTAQYKVTIKKDLLDFDPIAMYKVEQVPKNQLDIGGYLNYKNIVWFGTTWRCKYSVFFSAGVKVYDALLFGYSYEWVNNDISTFAGSTHELCVSYNFGKSKSNIEKQLRTSTEKIDSLNNRIGELNDEVYNLSKRTIKHATELEDLSDKIKGLRVNEGTINKELKKNDKFPKFAGVVLFATNSSALSSSFKNDLDVLASILKNNPDLRVDLRGHTDDVGTDTYNIALSDRRVISVKNYLVSKGVDPRVLSINGLGLRFPKVPNSTIDNRSMNRRVEIAILKSVDIR